MVATRRAHLLALCALLAVPPLGGTLADPTIKPAIIGLISTGRSTNNLDEFAGREGIFGGVVVQATWADLEPNQPAPGGPVTLVTTVIDNALNAVRSYNTAAAKLAPPNNRQIGIRLRIFAGCTDGAINVPAWVPTLDGSPVTITAPYNGGNEECTLGHFWDSTSNYAAAWRQFQTALAAAYDTEPLLQEISITSCTSYSAEPFFLPYPPMSNTDPPTYADEQQALQSAGYTDDKYRQCLANAVADYAAWQTTRLEFSFNGFYGLSPQNDIAASERIMRGCRQTAGLRCILSNHDLDTDTPSTILPIYALMRKFGPNITFQSYHTTPPDLEGTIRKGVSLGAGAIEIWPESFKKDLNRTLSNATVASWQSMFEPQQQ